LNTAATVSTSVVLCRDEERNRVVNFCRDRLQAGVPGSMYVSGVPGTGKSLTLRALEAAASTWGSPPPLVAYVNCMGLPDTREVRRSAPHALRTLCSLRVALADFRADH
jgi:Cdc6-like AAA superfamily ATPase